MRIVIIATPTSIDNKTTKVNRLREDKFFVVFLLGFCFVVGLCFIIFVKLRMFLISKNLVIIFKLNTILLIKIYRFYQTQ